MKMLKSIITVCICLSSLLLTQCKSSIPAIVNEEIQTDLELRNPVFAKAQPSFHKWVAGIEGGGSGIAMDFGWNALPENLVMKEAYFRNLWAPIQYGDQGYIANFNDQQNMPKDMIMHGDATQEAVNTPPEPRKTFAVALTEQQVGIIYEENGQLVYTILNNPIEKPQVALPAAAPKEKGF